MFILRYRNQWNEVFYFAKSGDVYNGIRLIAQTVQDKELAKAFDTAPDAALVLAEAGNPADWDILEKC